MKLLPSLLAAGSLLIAAPTFAHDEESLKTAPPGEPYVQVSLKFPGHFAL